MSATFNEDVQALKELVLHNPVRTPWKCLELLTCATQRSPLVFRVEQVLMV